LNARPQLAALGEHLDAAALGEGRFELAEELGLSTNGSRRDVFSATLEALSAHRTVAILEDVHWADEANRYGLPPFYSLHAWIWKPNPSGLLFAWNPRVSCED